MKEKWNLTGKIFGRITVIDFYGMKGCHRAWNCRCDCGNTLVCFATNLKRGLSTNCVTCRNKKVSLISIKHGCATNRMITDTYRTWQLIKRRCHNLRDKDYKNYGGRGIKVYSGWINDFESFRNYIGERPSSKHSIDRYPNNNGSYEPGNVRWATNTQQANNKRNNRLITHEGITDSVPNWAKRLNINRSTIYRRLKRSRSLDRCFKLIQKS